MSSVDEKPVAVVETVVEKKADDVNNCADVEKKIVELRSSDGELFQVEEKVAILSITIKNLVDDGCGDSEVPMPNVTGKTLAKVIEYCKKHAEAEETDKKALEAFDAEFVKIYKDDLFEIVLAANYMNIKGLLDLTCQAVADMIKDMSVEECRKTFNITNDFSPEEEAEIRKENAWAFEETKSS